MCDSVSTFDRALGNIFFENLCMNFAIPMDSLCGFAIVVVGHPHLPELQYLRQQRFVPVRLTRLSAAPAACSSCVFLCLVHRRLGCCCVCADVAWQCVLETSTQTVGARHAALNLAFDLPLVFFFGLDP